MVEQLLSDAQAWEVRSQKKDIYTESEKRAIGKVRNRENSVKNSAKSPWTGQTYAAVYQACAQHWVPYGQRDPAGQIPQIGHSKRAFPHQKQLYNGRPPS